MRIEQSTYVWEAIINSSRSSHNQINNKRQTQSTKEDRILSLLGDLTIKMNHVIKLLEENK